MEPAPIEGRWDMMRPDTSNVKGSAAGLPALPASASLSQPAFALLQPDPAHADAPPPARVRPPRAIPVRRPRGGRGRGRAVELRPVLRPVRPLVERAPAPRHGPGRPGGVHRAQSPRP